MNTAGSNRALWGGLALLLAFITFVAVNVAANLTVLGLRLDLSENKLYTLSDGTRNVLKRIGEPVTIRFYYSERLGQEIPAYASYAQRVRDLLEEYASRSGGKLKLEIYDPKPYTDVEDRAVAYGLQGVPVNQGGELVYFGLVGTNATDDEQVVPFFQPERERFLEYDLSKLVYNLANPKKKVIALISELPIQGDPMQMMMGGAMPQPWMVVEQIQQLFEVRTLGVDIEKLDDDVDLLMLVHPKTLSERTQYAIDQFVLRGGKALVFVDPQSEAEAGRQNPRQPPSIPTSGLPRLFDAWGLSLVENRIAGDRMLARRVNAGAGTRVRAVDYVAWITLRQRNLSQTDFATNQIAAINLASPGIIEPKDGATTTFAPLLSTTPASMRIEVEKLRTTPDPAALLRDFKAENRIQVVAARITGPAKTAFPDGPPKSEPKKDEAKPAEGAAPAAPAEPLKESKVPINVIVVADTDLLEDRFWVQVQDFFGQRLAVPSASNGDFVINAVDTLTGSQDLIGLRSRAVSQRPFELVQEIQRDAELKFRAKERELQDKLKETEKQLGELRSKEQGQGQVILNPEQAQAIENFRKDMLATRRELRDVQRALREDIDWLQALVQLANIALMPALVAFAALIAGVLRLRRRARAHRAQPARA